MRIRLISLAITLLAALALAPGAWAAPTTFLVDNTGNAADATPGDGDCSTSGFACTLRAAIEESNATAAGAPYTIAFGVTQISLPTTLTITRDDVFIDGCGVTRADFPSEDAGPPNTPASNRCVGLIGTGAAIGLQVGDANSDPTDVAIFNVAMTNFPAAAIRVWGADRTQIGGNLFGRRINGQNEDNGSAVRLTGRTQNGTIANPAMTNIIGGPSNAQAGADAACDTYCNTIVNSTIAGIDLVGIPSGSGPGDSPAGGGGGADEGTTIAGNWIGVYDTAGSAAPNAVAAKLGNSLDTSIATGSDFNRGNVIAGNTKGLDQGSGTTAVAILDGNVFGISPDGETSVPNGSWNAHLGGSDTLGGGAFVQNSTFGPAAIGLEIAGPRANLIGNVFRSPDSAKFTTAAIRLTPEADNAYIGSNVASPFGVCFPFIDYCNTIGDTGDNAPGIWVDGADDARIWRNAIGAELAPPIPGPPIRISGGATGADVGDNDDDANRRNWLGRTAGPAIDVENASQIVIGDNEGYATTFAAPGSLFTDLRPGAGPGNSGGANNGIQAPVVTVSSLTGVGGTGIPGARINVLLQEGPAVVGDPDPIPEGSMYPPTPSVTTVGADGIWGVAFPTPLKLGAKLLASQTTADGSSEYASPQGASESNPPPIISFQSGPSGVVDTRSATFTFSSNRAGTRLTCSVDAGAFVPCSSPFTLNGLDVGGHQLQVKGTDPTGKVGPPASRTWIVQIPEPVAPGGGTPKAAAKTVRFTSVVSLPSAKKCISRRTLRLTVRAPKGAKLKSAEVRLGKRKVRTVRKAGKVTVSLKGLPRGKFVVKVKVTLTDGRTATGSRTYRTCAKKATKKSRR